MDTNKSTVFGLSSRFTQDGLDGIMCAYTGCLYLKGKAEELKGIDGCIVVPSHHYVLFG